MQNPQFKELTTILRETVEKLKSIEEILDLRTKMADQMAVRLNQFEHAMQDDFHKLQEKTFSDLKKELAEILIKNLKTPLEGIVEIQSLVTKAILQLKKQVCNEILDGRYKSEKEYIKKYKKAKRIVQQSLIKSLVA